MPVEYELKFVLSDPQGILPAQLAGFADRFEIEQIYTPGGARLRRIKSHRDRDPHFTFTFKENINGKLLEFEQEVDEADYELARTGAIGQLFKVRYKFAVVGGDWDVDFLMTARPEEGGAVYFAMAELEMPEGTSWSIPELLQPHVVLEVPHSQSTHFTNRKLCDPEYARTAVQAYLESQPTA